MAGHQPPAAPPPPVSCVQRLMTTSQFALHLYYSLWYYSTDRISIGLRMQEHRSRRKALKTAEDCFGLALRERRQSQRFTQEELAFKSGYHPTYIGQLERGKKSPSLRAIVNLAAALNTSGSELLTRVEALQRAEQHPRSVFPKTIATRKA